MKTTMEKLDLFKGMTLSDEEMQWKNFNSRNSVWQSFRGWYT